MGHAIVLGFGFCFGIVLFSIFCRLVVSYRYVKAQQALPPDYEFDINDYIVTVCPSIRRASIWHENDPVWEGGSNPYPHLIDDARYYGERITALKIKKSLAEREERRRWEAL